jgi:predicted transposase/invertase (TIGR01784 family)
MKEEAGSNHETIRARMLYNLCDLHSSQSSKGIQYNQLKRSYQVMFCLYPIFQRQRGFIYRFSMRHDTEYWQLHDGIRSILIDLSKLGMILKKPVKQMTGIECFSIFLRYASDPRHREIVNQIFDMREEIAVAGEVLMNVSKDEHERAIFRNRRIAQNDMESNLATARKIGLDEGMVRGRVEGEKAKALTIAKGLFSTNLSIEEIARVTGLSYAEVERLRVIN